MMFLVIFMTNIVFPVIVMSRNPLTRTKCRKKAFYFFKSGSGIIHFSDAGFWVSENFCLSGNVSIMIETQQFWSLFPKCVDNHRWCDGQTDCLYSEDEIECQKIGMVRNEGETFYQYTPLPPPALVDLDPSLTVLSKPGIRMTPLNISYHGGKVVCPETHFLCRSEDYCLPVYLKCNLIRDCPGEWISSCLT